MLDELLNNSQHDQGYVTHSSKINNDCEHNDQLRPEHTVQLQILSLNTCGLKSKLICPEFTSFASDYDIKGIQKSKLDDIDIIMIENY